MAVLFSILTTGPWNLSDVERAQSGPETRFPCGQQAGERMANKQETTGGLTKIGNPYGEQVVATASGREPGPSPVAVLWCLGPVGPAIAPLLCPQ